MSEMIKTYMLDEPYVLVPMERKKFYAEQTKVVKKTGVPTRATEIVQIFLFNEDGELFVQKRSKDKDHNPGLLDKSIGGHVLVGDTADYTAMVETVQELQVPSVVLQSDDDFYQTHQLLKGYLDTIAIVRHERTDIITLDRVIKGETYQIAHKADIYFGVYGGRTKAVDGEAKGTLQYSLDDLEEDIASSPKLFTEDLKYYLEHYRSQMDVFVKSIMK